MKIKFNAKLLLFAVYILGIFALAYLLILTMLSKQSQGRIVIGVAREFEGRAVSLTSYWKDDDLVSELVKTGVFKENETRPDYTIWLTTVSIKNNQGKTIKVSIEDFTLLDADGEEHKPVLDPYSARTIKSGEQEEIQAAFYISNKSVPEKLVYTVNEDKSRKLIFYIGE